MIAEGLTFGAVILFNASMRCCARCYGTASIVSSTPASTLRHNMCWAQALSATESLDEAAELLMKSKTNVRMVVSKLEVDLGRHLDLPTAPGPTPAEEGKLLLVRLPKRSRSQLTGAGAASLPCELPAVLVYRLSPYRQMWSRIAMRTVAILLHFTVKAACDTA